MQFPQSKKQSKNLTGGPKNHGKLTKIHWILMIRLKSFHDPQASKFLDKT